MYRIVGRDEAARAELTTRLVRGLTRCGLEVSVIGRSADEHALDRPGKDSYIHRSAGASSVTVVSEKRWAIMSDASASPADADLTAQLARLRPVDVALAVGFDEGPGVVLRLGPDGAIELDGGRFGPDAIEALCARLACAT